MSKTAALAVATAIICWSVPALAGIVITQEQTLNTGSRSRTSQQTIMVQGNKQKIVDERHTVVIDLDTGKQVVLMPATKTYFETSFGPHGQGGQMMQRAARTGTLDFKKTGKTRTVAGYKCEDYEASGQSLTGQYTTTQCLSKTAPGAAEFTAFENAMLQKLKGAGPTMNGLPKDTVPLASDSTIKIERRAQPRTPGGQGGESAGAAQAMPQRPPVVIHTVVSKIVKQNLPADTFTVPADYKLANVMPAPMGMGAAGQASAAAAPSSAPSAAAKPPGN